MSHGPDCPARCPICHDTRISMSEKRYVDLGNNVFIDKKKTTSKTVIIKDYSSGVLSDVYIHHNKGPGRLG